MTRPAVDVLREAVGRAAEASSQRAVAAQVGVPHRTIGKFLAGSAPRSKTLKKLQAWYVSSIVPAGGASPETATAAVFILLDPIPQPRRAEAVRELVQALGRIHQDYGGQRPEWIGELESARS